MSNKNRLAVAAGGVIALFVAAIVSWQSSRESAVDAERNRARGELLESHAMLLRDQPGEALALLASAYRDLDSTDRREAEGLLRTWGGMALDFPGAFKEIGSSVVFNWNNRAYLHTASGEPRKIGDAPIEQSTQNDTGSQVLTLSDGYVLRIFNRTDGSILGSAALDKVLTGESIRADQITFDSKRKEYVIDGSTEASYAGGSRPYRIRLSAHLPYRVVSVTEGDSIVGPVSDARVARLEFPNLRDEKTAWTFRKGVLLIGAGTAQDDWIFPESGHSDSFERRIESLLRSVSSLRETVPNESRLKEAETWLELAAHESLQHLDYEHGRFRFAIALVSGGVRHGDWIITKLDSAGRILDWSMFENAGDAASLRVHGQLAYIPDIRIMGGDPFTLVDLDSLASFTIDSVPDGWGPSIPALSPSGRMLAIIPTVNPQDEGSSDLAWVYRVDLQRHQLTLWRRVSLPANSSGSSALHLTDGGIMIVADTAGKVTAIDVKSERELWQRELRVPSDDRRVHVVTDPTARFAGVFGGTWFEMISVWSGVPQSELMGVSEFESVNSDIHPGSILSATIDSTGVVVLQTDSGVVSRKAPLSSTQLEALLRSIEKYTGRPRGRPHEPAALQKTPE